MSIDSNEWEAMPSGGEEQPEALSAFACCKWEEVVLLFGGTNLANQQNNDLWQYSLTTHTWRKLPQVGEVPSPR